MYMYMYMYNVLSTCIVACCCGVLHITKQKNVRTRTQNVRTKDEEYDRSLVAVF